MKNSLLKKGKLVAVIFLFVGMSILPTAGSLSIETIVSGENGDLNVDNKVYVEPDQSIGSIINESLLDLRFIHNITENLSRIIFTEYNESTGEIAKGRWFGTKGEHKAADILYENMTKLGLYTTKEEINNTVDTLSIIPKIASDIQILERGLTVYNKSSSSRTNINNCYIGPMKNFTDSTSFKRQLVKEIKYNHLIIGNIIEKLIPLIPFKLPLVNGTLDKKYNFYDTERLTNNFSYKNLRVIKKPTNISFVGDLINRIKNNEPFVYIGKEMTFSKWPKEKTYYNGFFYKILDKIMPDPERYLWPLFQPNCKGVILFDSDDKTYNTCDLGALPVIAVNRSIGLEIFNNPNNYLVDFYVNQSWNDSVLSYNVIGQLNGTNPDETIIISCLYDSTWCQGTGDSAIGMAIVLGIAKYFVDNKITPKCNIRFIGFCGEEAGMRGAYFYEATHRNENITTIIDLNQLGFLPTDLSIKFNIASNNESLNSTLFRIANETEYTKRTNNVTKLMMDIREKTGGPVSNAMAFAEANLFGIKPYNTIFFAKYYKWNHHHRDGINHMEGDVLKYFYWKDTSITGELIFNITRYFSINPDCWFENDYSISIDSPDDEDSLNDSIDTTFTIKTSLPQDLVMINASLYNEGRVVANKLINYTVTSAGIEDTIRLTVPGYEEPGWYSCTLSLYNSTGRINEILHLKDNNINDTSPSPPMELYPYGYGK